MTIRKATPTDLNRINEIHNQAILEKFKCADLTPWTIEKRIKSFEERDHEEYPTYVAEIDNTVVGFANVNPYRPGRTALKQTVEISCFIDRNYREKGVAKKLMDYMETACIKQGRKAMFAIIIDNNDASIKLVEKCGYEKWGHLPKVASFDGIEVGHLYYGKRIA